MADIIKETEEKMEKTLEAAKNKLAAIRAGRANVNMLDAVVVSYYGSMTPLRDLARLSAPEARILLIDPFDKGAIKDIEKGIQSSNLGLTPNNDGKVIRINIPELTEERRKEYLKLAKNEAEESKIAVRNVRKDMNTKAKKMQKDSEITEDDLKTYEDKIQKLTDLYIKKVDELLAKKEKEILGK